MFDDGMHVEADKAHAMPLYKPAWQRRNRVAANNRRGG